MTTASVMTTNLVTLQPQDRVADALLLMCRHKVHNLPVIDSAGVYLGLFSLRHLTHALLPKAAQLDQHNLLMHVNFMPDTLDEISQRLNALGCQPVSELLEKADRVRVCAPDTPLPEMLQLLYESPTSVPVVVLEGEGQRLTGMVSHWDVLAKLMVNLLDTDQNADCAAVADGEGG